MKNRYEIRGDVTAIFLKRKNGEILETLIDTEDLPLVDSFNGSWVSNYSKGGRTYYVVINDRINQKNKAHRLHRVVTKVTPDLQVDHIHHDTLDNRKSNLRIVTSAQNKQNRQGANRRNRTSGVRGVSWAKRFNKWESYTYHNKKRMFLGYYTLKSEAERASREARLKYMPFSEDHLNL